MSNQDNIVLTDGKQIIKMPKELSLNSKNSSVKIRNKVVKINLMGGVLGLFQSPSHKIQHVLKEENARGWNVKFVLPPNPNILFLVLSVIILLFTFCIYMPLPAYILIMEKENI